MEFSSPPIYLDPPNWQQLGVVNENTPQLSTARPPSLALGAGGGETRGSIRPDSMVERARLAKIVTQPETTLKCPRCESTNTKFCYFNNYSLSQPRHFCKTCRRYWTRGGALRNVPVGGGCRRNKRSTKRGTRSSKSPVRVDKTNTPTISNIMISHLPNPSNNNPHYLSFLNTPLHNFTTSDFSTTQNGLTFGGNIHQHHQGGTSHDDQMNLSSRFADQFKFQQMQQLPFFPAALEQPSNLYQFDHGVEYENIGSKAFDQSEVITNVKVEENKSANSQGLNLTQRNNLGVTNNQCWSAYNTSTSTSQIL